MNRIDYRIRAVVMALVGWSLATCGNAVAYISVARWPRFPRLIHVDEILIGLVFGVLYWALERHNAHTAHLRTILLAHHRRARNVDQLIMRHDLRARDIMALTEAVLERHGIK